MLDVSGLDLSSAFFTKVSFTTGADDAEAGEGFCGGFWAYENGTHQKKLALKTQHKAGMVIGNNTIV